MENILIKSKIPEVGALLKRIIAVYQQADLGSDLALQTMMGEIDTTYQALSTAIQRDDAVSQLAELDDQRDDICRGLNHMLLAGQYSTKNKIKEAAEALYQTFDKYGTAVLGMSYAIESSKIVSLLGELSNAQAHIKTILGLSDIVADLQEAQNRFEQERVVYEKEKTADNKNVAPYDLKKTAIQLINGKLKVYLQAMAIVNHTQYGELFDTLTTMIKESNESVRRRGKKVEEVLT